MPLHFLRDEILTPKMGQKEALLPYTLWTWFGPHEWALWTWFWPHEWGRKRHYFPVHIVDVILTESRSQQVASVVFSVDVMIHSCELHIIPFYSSELDDQLCKEKKDCMAFSLLYHLVSS
jgi:hypothetical protein